MSLGQSHRGFAERQIRRDQQRAAKMQPLSFCGVCHVLLGALVTAGACVLGLAEVSR